VTPLAGVAIWLTSAECPMHGRYREILDTALGDDFCRLRQ